jgi:hypothetical protein
LDKDDDEDDEEEEEDDDDDDEEEDNDDHDDGDSNSDAGMLFSNSANISSQPAQASRHQQNYARRMKHTHKCM